MIHRQRRTQEWWIKFVIISATSLFFGGCHQSLPPPIQSDPVPLFQVALSTNIVTSAQIQEMLSAKGISTLSGFTFDKQYAVPEIGWLMTVFSDAFRNAQGALRINTWANSANDCAKISSFAKTYADILYNNTSNKIPDAALAFGEMAYSPKNGGYHMINVLLVAVDGEVEVMFWEPQLAQVVNISREELVSCDFFLF